MKKTLHFLFVKYPIVQLPILFAALGLATAMGWL